MSELRRAGIGSQDASRAGSSLRFSTERYDKHLARARRAAPSLLVAAGGEGRWGAPFGGSVWLLPESRRLNG